ncbi:agmatinase [Pseudokordiimonas caeni]|uniref:agmatinase n=1 Tax=Pseudokordiimonas caeni TaxID=2997908 RepID=UPI00281119A5|nr:agmatinase [Pseudokordiimonas caeni]
MSQGMMEPYGGHISYLRFPVCETAEGLDLAIMGVPFDLNTTGRAGARFGPRGIREMSLTMAEFPWGVWPWGYHLRDKFKVGDIGDVMGFTAYTERMMPAVEAAADKVLATGASLLTLGGDHSITYPLLKAHARKHGPLALIHFDAHSDTWIDDDINHGTMFHHAIKDGTIVPENSIQLGMRTPNPDEQGMLVLDGLECLKTPAAEMAKRIRERVGNRPAYLTFDIDFLDPAYAPATGTPVVGGPNVAYARDVLRALVGMNIVGGDQVEVAPHYEGAAQITALAGATIAADILYLIGASRLR